jgi:hypothetical protein
MLSDHLAEILLGGNVSEGSTFVVDLGDDLELCFNVNAPVAV